MLLQVARDNVLPMFNEIFSSISCVVADPDQNVKNGSELLDRLLKDIVTESKKFEAAMVMDNHTKVSGTCTYYILT